MTNQMLHDLVRRNDCKGLSLCLENSATARSDINSFDADGFTPLMLAVIDPRVSSEIVDILLRHGADIELSSRIPRYPWEEAVEQPGEEDGGPKLSQRNARTMSFAILAGDPRKVSQLVEGGGDVHFRERDGCDALFAARAAKDSVDGKRRVELIQFLLRAGATVEGINTVQTRHEADKGLRHLSREGQFEAISLLLSAGADPSSLSWTPLMRAVAVGTIAEVKAMLRLCMDLEEIDWWKRTPWLLSVHTDDVQKALCIKEAGANIHARGHYEQTALSYAIQCHCNLMLEWLLSLGLDVNEPAMLNGDMPLMIAAEHGNRRAVEMLIAAGADVKCENDGKTALDVAGTRDIAIILSQAGCGTNNCSYPLQRVFLGYGREPDERELYVVSKVEYRRARSRRFGENNPEHMQEPFWEAMIRAGVSGYTANKLLKGESSFGGEPVWSAERFGQSITILPDGRIVQVGGEHEDWYDPDFCIYNDVFVHKVGGAIEIYGYPETVFPPTDFHTATLLGDGIYIVGGLGYKARRQSGLTPVYRLDTRNFMMNRLSIAGTGPGWVWEHRAEALSDHQIRISGGKIAAGEEAEDHANEGVYVLDVQAMIWRMDA